jgi:DNA-binding response OmpR family regulator
MVAFSETSGVAGDTPDPSVLVVEDDALLRFALAMDLRQAGFRVREAANASEAETALEAGDRIDLLVTDIEMPGGRDGLALAKSVRADLPEVGIIVVSGTLPDRGIVGVADLFFGKPYDAERLVEKAKLLLTAPARGGDHCSRD